jgi:ribosomal subunit interface protein
MDIRISGRQVEVGEAFRTHATAKLQEIAQTYFPRSKSAAVTVGRIAHGVGFEVDIHMHVRQGVQLKADAKDDAEAKAAFDSAAERIAKQLRRYKRRIKAHHNDALRDLSVQVAASYVVQSTPADEEAPEGDHPIIIAETAAEIPTVSVSDAVMLMDLSHSPAMLFKNAGSGHFSMVYRRPDGNIGWVDSGPGMRS